MWSATYLTTSTLMCSAEEPSLIAGALPFFDGRLLTALLATALDFGIQVSILEFFASAGLDPDVACSTFIERNVVCYTFVFKRTQVAPVSVQIALVKSRKVGVPPRFAMKVDDFHG